MKFEMLIVILLIVIIIVISMKKQCPEKIQEKMFSFRKCRNNQLEMFERTNIEDDLSEILENIKERKEEEGKFILKNNSQIDKQYYNNNMLYKVDWNRMRRGEFYLSKQFEDESYLDWEFLIITELYAYLGFITAKHNPNKDSDGKKYKDIRMILRFRRKLQIEPREKSCKEFPVQIYTKKKNFCDKYNWKVYSYNNMEKREYRELPFLLYEGDLSNKEVEMNKLVYRNNPNLAKEY